MPAEDYVRFIILSDARTGSNLLVELLNSHPRVLCFREIFNFTPDHIDYGVSGWDDQDRVDLELRSKDPRRFLAERIFNDHDDDVRAVGFKFHYGHFWFHPDLLPLLTDDVHLRVIHLQRRNLLRMLVSLRLAEQTGEYMRHDWSAAKSDVIRRNLTPRAASDAVRHPVAFARKLGRFLRPVPSRQPAPAPEREAITLTHDECVREFYRMRHEVRHFGELFASHPMIVLDYEHLVEDREGTLATVEQFLDVPAVPPSGITLKRQNPEPLSELIANYAELRASFEGKPELAFFDESSAAR